MHNLKMAGCLAGAVLILAACGSAPQGSQASAAAVGKGFANPIPCGVGSSQIGTIAYLAQGSSVREVVAQGLTVSSFKKHPGLVFMAPPSGASAGAALEALSSRRVFASQAPVTAQSSDPTLVSCAYDLSDSPRAAALAQLARSAIVASGAATLPQVSSEGVVTTISDDPLDPSRKVVVVRIVGSPVTSSMPVKVIASQLIVVLVDPSGSSVDDIGAIAN